MTRPRFHRILLKLSGEALMGPNQFGIDPATVASMAGEVAAAKAAGHELCLVVGGGNIFRGIAGAAQGFDRATGDYMGMLATVMNALAVQNALEKIGVDTRVQSAIPMASVCEPYIRRRAMRHMEKGRIVIFAAGTGNPYFTTDTAAALRAAEMGCNALFKGTSVDGVYDADPKKVASANALRQRRASTRCWPTTSRSWTPARWRCAATTIFRSSCSTSASPATSPRCWPGEGRRRSSRTRSERMPAYDKNDLERRMHGALEVLKHDLAGLRTGRASTALLDPIQVEVYGAQHADQPGRDGVGAGAADAVGAGLGPQQRRLGREGDPQRRAWASTRSSTAS